MPSGRGRFLTYEKTTGRDADKCYQGREFSHRFAPTIVNGDAEEGLGRLGGETMDRGFEAWVEAVVIHGVCAALCLHARQWQLAAYGAESSDGVECNADRR